MAENQNLIATLARSGRMRIAAALVVTALVGGGLGVIMLRGDASGQVPLYTGLDLDEASSIISKLDAANIKNSLEGGGSAVFVDRSKLDSARMMLAEQGLPSKGSVGWEIFDKTEALGATSFVQNINKTRALQGELERTIGSLDMVKAAKVTLALPDKPLFQQDNQKPKASVLLQLTGNAMAQPKVRAIQNLVAAAVPGLAVADVNVVDDQGHMLAQATGDSADGGAGSGSDERKGALEDDMRRKVLDIVENITGQGAAKVTVAMDVDFNRVTETKEDFDPDRRVLRSSTTSEETSNNAETQPGDTATVAANVPTGAKPPEANSPKSQAATSTTSETQNYEISKTVHTEVMDGGRVKRLSVAVVLDNVRVPGADGKPPTFTPRDPAEVQKILGLVRTAVGYTEARGDIVTVENVPFARPDVSMGDAKAPGPFDFDKFDIVQGVEIGAMLITALALVFFVLRPLVKGLFSKPDGAGGSASAGELGFDASGRAIAGPDGSAGASAGEGGASAAGGGSAQRSMPIPDGKALNIDIPTPDRFDAGIDVARINGQVKASSIKKISEVVSSHPDESLAIIRSWLAEEGRAA